MSRPVLTTLVFALLAAPLPPAAAADPSGLAQTVLSQPVQPRPRDCENANMIDLKFCAAADFRAADKALNDAYKEARSGSADDKARAILLDAQRTWLRYRDTLCTWESYGYNGGSMQGLVELNCLARVTIQQTRELVDALKP